MTAREAHWMVEAKDRNQWNHTAQICSVIANAFGGRRRLKPDDFNPYKGQ